ncbi:MAG: exosome complex RNA-binding protein Csl4 [Nitrososphaerota archaeon]|nr:exosome complex RNA-binding protein Csl4 [Nitrososphaerota archaeon]
MSGERKTRLAVPGEKLGVIEEYSSSYMTYEKSGDVRAMGIGEVALDRSNRTIGVAGTALKSPFPRLGDVVEGTIEAITGAGGAVRIYMVNGVEVSSDLSGTLRVRDVRGNPVRLGDMVRCTVTNTTNNNLWLGIGDENLGVMRTACGICGGPVEPLPPDRVRCEGCGFSDTRKLIGFRPFPPKREFGRGFGRGRGDRRFGFRRRRPHDMGPR